MAAILGTAELIRNALRGPEVSSAEGLVVERWADRPARLARMDRLCAIALVACDAALVDAGASPGASTWRPERTGVVLGTAFGCHATNERYYRGYLGGGVDGASPRDFAYTLPSSPVGEITIHHRILGPASTTVAGLSAAIDALAEAMRHLAADRADHVLVAAADVSTPMLGRMGLPAAHDCAASLWLARAGDGPRVERAIGRYVAGDPVAAARAAVDALRVEPSAIYASALVRAAFAGARALDERALSAAPLLAVRHALAARERAGVIVAADPAGQAGAALVAV